VRQVRLVAALVLLVSGSAHGQTAVIDVNSIRQGIANETQTVAHLVQQYQQMLQQLQAAQQTLQSLQGFRPAGQVFLNANPARQALSGNFAASMAGISANGVGGGTLVTTTIYGQTRATPCTGWQGNSASVSACQAPLMLTAAMSQTVNQTLANAQSRVSQLTSLSAQVDTTSDTKASLDLQTRIAAEQTQLLAEKAVLDNALAAEHTQMQLAIQHQSDLGLQMVLQSGRRCYSCP
jgi:hypothetical protein